MIKMSREDLIKYAKSITNPPAKEEKKPRYRATKVAKPIHVPRKTEAEQFVDIEKIKKAANAMRDSNKFFVNLKADAKSKGLERIMEQYKAAILAGDDLLADTIMDQIYFLSFRDNK